VLESRVPAFKSHFPEARSPAQCILVLVSLSVVSGLFSRSHKSRHPYGGKPGFPIWEARLPKERLTNAFSPVSTRVLPLSLPFRPPLSLHP
jgi:hypothetical protein